MTRFSATNESEAVVTADRGAVWGALTDPVLLPRLTPLLHHIEADGDRWRWEMAGISVLGARISPCFTEKMVFDEPSRIEYTHAPPSGSHERTGVEGWYQLDEHDEGTRLGISLTVTVDLPLSRLAAPAVQRVMEGVIERTGDRFAQNLLRHLGAREVRR